MNREVISELIASIKSYRHKYIKYSKSQYRQAVVSRLFRNLDWDMDNPDEVEFDYSELHSETVYDICIQISKKSRIFISVDVSGGNPPMDIDFNYDDYLVYITGYSQWYVYCPKLEDTEPVMEFDMFDDSEAEIIEKISLLSKEKIADGTFNSYVNQKIERISQKDRVRDAIAEIWNDIKKNKFPAFHQFLIEELQTRTDLEVNPEELNSIFESIVHVDAKKEEIIDDPDEKDIENEDDSSEDIEREEDSEEENSVDDDSDEDENDYERFSSGKPKGAILFKEFHETDKWCDIVIQTILAIRERVSYNNFKKILMFEYDKMKYVTDRNVRSKKSFNEIPDTNYFLNRFDLYRQRSVRFCQKLLEYFGFDKNELKIIMESDEDYIDDNIEANESDVRKIRVKTWFELSKWASNNDMLAPWERQFAYFVGNTIKKRGKMTDTQAQNIAKILKKARKQGFEG